jgi:hypothetical protein
MEITKDRLEFYWNAAVLNSSVLGEGYSYFVEGAIFADTHPDWTHVTASLPKDDQPVLVYDKYGLFHCAYYSTQSDEWISNMKDETAISGVEYWMPMPQAPRTVVY